MHAGFRTGQTYDIIALNSADDIVDFSKQLNRAGLTGKTPREIRAQVIDHVTSSHKNQNAPHQTIHDDRFIVL